MRYRDPRTDFRYGVRMDDGNLLMAVTEKRTKEEIMEYMKIIEGI